MLRGGRRRIAELERELEAARAENLELEATRKLFEDEMWACRIEPMRWVTQRCIEEFGRTVRAGPFTGLRYPEGLTDGVDALVAKLLGAYERELHRALASMIESAPQIFVDVGAAEGYYAVGFALASPGTRVLAYDSVAGKREDCARLAAANGVSERVEIGATCDPAELAALEPGACVLLDCEGCELELICDEAMPGLRHATLLVELHDSIEQPVTGTVLRRLERSHEAELIESEPRNIDDFPELAPVLGWNNRQLAIWEFRPRPMRWAVLRPRASR